MIVDIQLVLLALFAFLLAVLATQLLALRAGLSDLRQHLLEVRARIGEAEHLAAVLRQSGGAQKGPFPDPLEPAPAQQAAGAGHTPPDQPPQASPPEPPREEHGEPAAPRQGGARPTGSFQDTVQDLYRRWCLEERRPTPPERIDIGLLRYAGDRRDSDLSAAMHVFRDDPQTGEFVRFWAVGTEKGLAFPNPEAFFNEVVHRILFPGLTADAFGNHRQLASTTPVRIHRQADGSWQKVP